MRLLANIYKGLSVRLLASFGCTVQSQQPFHTEKLTERGLIRVAGKEVVPFLQGLVTNDIEHLQNGSPAMYSMFLNKGGRVLYDSIIYRSPSDNTYFIECDKNVTQELLKHLKLFRVRRKIEVDSVCSEYSIWVMHGGLDNLESDSLNTSLQPIVKLLDNKVIVAQDPRLKLLGTRIIVPHDYNVCDINKYFPHNELELAEVHNDYTTLRYKLGIGEGIVNHVPNKSFPMETNCDYLHGISFQKGCYIGQELTARTYHTGVIRKRLMPISIPENLIDVTVDANIQTQNGSNVGKLRGQKNSFGLALIRIEQALEAPSLLLNGAVCKVSKPFWWPGASPSRDSIAVGKQM